MTKRFYLLLISFMSIILFTGCPMANRTAEVRIIVSDWNGWDKNYKAVEEEKTYKLKVGDKVKPRKNSPFEIEITKIEGDYIEFKTNEGLCISKNGSFKMNEYKNVFTLSKDDGELKLITPTYDAGDIYKFEIIKIEKTNINIVEILKGQ